MSTPPRSIADILASLPGAKPPPPPPAPVAPAASPYVQVAAERKVVDAAGKAFAPTHEGKPISPQADLPGRVAYVSRHSLTGSGVICPLCASLAAETGDWRAVHLAAKYGEGVTCYNCKAMLFAAPDDDIDPVKPGQPYDETIYHTFARPPGWQPPRQRTTTDALVMQDWVVIENFSGPVFRDGRQLPVQDLDRAEGRVIGEDGEHVDVALNGMEAMGSAGEGGGTGLTMARVPRTHAFKFIQPTLRLNDRVRVIQGKYRKRVGKVIAMKGAEIQVTIDPAGAAPGFVAPLPIEQLEAIVDNERFHGT